MAEELEPVELNLFFTVLNALGEDLGWRWTEEGLEVPDEMAAGDLTSSAVVPESLRAEARVEAHQGGILAGMAPALLTFELLCGDELKVIQQLSDGARVEAGTTVLQVEAGARGLLVAERTALNFLQHLSGVATLTSRFVEQLAGSGVRVLDTRKTTPGLRFLEKAAVAAGGGVNHRMGLYDAIMLKDNHVRLGGKLGQVVSRAIANARQRQEADGKDLVVIVEVRGRKEALEAVEAGARWIMLDNMAPKEVAECVQAVRAADRGREVTIEASGGITLASARDFAIPGLDFVSVGSLTHSAPALDLSMSIEPLP